MANIVNYMSHGLDRRDVQSFATTLADLAIAGTHPKYLTNSDNPGARTIHDNTIGYGLEDAETPTNTIGIHAATRKLLLRAFGDNLVEALSKQPAEKTDMFLAEALQTVVSCRGSESFVFYGPIVPYLRANCTLIGSDDTPIAVPTYWKNTSHDEYPAATVVCEAQIWMAGFIQSPERRHLIYDAWQKTFPAEKLVA